MTETAPLELHVAPLTDHLVPPLEELDDGRALVGCVHLDYDLHMWGSFYGRVMVLRADTCMYSLTHLLDHDLIDSRPVAVVDPAHHLRRSRLSLSQATAA